MNNNHKANFLEQDKLNYIYRDKIGLLPLKYGFFIWKFKYSENLYEKF